MTIEELAQFIDSLIEVMSAFDSARGIRREDEDVSDEFCVSHEEVVALLIAFQTVSCLAKGEIEPCNPLEFASRSLSALMEHKYRIAMQKAGDAE